VTQKRSGYQEAHFHRITGDIPQDPGIRKQTQKQIREVIEKEEQVFLGWRTVPTNDSFVGGKAKQTKPFIRQMYGKDPIGSMGYDLPLAVLSQRPQLLYNYFKQLFAQVTNPPIDAIREKIITSTVTTIGGEGNLVNPKPESCQQIQLQTTKSDLVKLCDSRFKSEVFSILFAVGLNPPNFSEILEELFAYISRIPQEIGLHDLP
jgi:hypothetical protein